MVDKISWDIPGTGITMPFTESAMQKDFRNLLAKLQPQLDKTKVLANKIQADFMRAKKLKESDEVKKALLTPTDSIIANAAALRQAVELQADGMRLLRRSPPGMTSAIIDFLYMITVDKNDVSQAKSYRAKLDKLQSAIKPTQDIGNALGLMSWNVQKIVEQVATSVSSNIPDPTAKKEAIDDLIGFGEDAINQAYNEEAEALSSGINLIYESFKRRGQNQDSTRQYLKEFLTLLGKSLATSSTAKKPQAKEELTRAIQIVQRAVENYFPKRDASLTRQAATANDLLSLSSKYQASLLEIQTKLKSFSGQTDEIQSRMRGSKQKKLELADKYVGFIKALLGDGERSVTTSLDRLALSLKRLTATIEMNTIPEDSGQSEDSSQPPPLPSSESTESTESAETSSPLPDRWDPASARNQYHAKSSLARRKKEIYSQLKKLKTKS